MGNFIINIATKSTPTKTGTVIPDIGFKYSSILNQINESYITISGMGIVDRELIELGSEVYIYRKGVLKFRGIIDNYDILGNGAATIHISGFERWLTMANGDYAGSPWKATASATIAAAILGESTELGIGTIEAGTNIDFRASPTDSLWSALLNLIRKTSQDVSMDYTASPPAISVLDHVGSVTSVATLNDEFDITAPRITLAYPLGNKIIVYGKGDGANQVTGTASDATSIAAYGTITRIVVDKSIMSNAEAAILAAAELALTKDPTKIYDFDVINPDVGIVLGDILTINTTDITDENVRVVGIDRGELHGREYMTLQVTNPEYKQNIKKKNLIMAGISKKQQDANTYMQGATNIWGDTQILNANATDPLILRFYVPPQVNDEAGNTRINDVKLSYTSKNYRTYSGAITGSTGTASTGAGITNTSATSGAGITNAAAGANDTGYSLGGYSVALTGDNSWKTVTNGVNIGGYTYMFHGISGSFSVPLYSATWVTDAQSYYIRAFNDTDTEYYPDSTGYRIHGGVSADGYGMLAIPFYLHIPKNWTSKTYYFQYKITNEQLWSPTGLVQTLYYNYHGSRGHTHANTFNDASHTNANTFNDASHTNPVGSLTSPYSLDEATTTSSNTIIKIYNSANVLLWNSGNRGQIEEQDIDISSYITANDYYRIEIYPNNNALMYGTVYLKGGVDS